MTEPAARRFCFWKRVKLMQTENLMEALTGLYRSCGYRNFRMSKFEKYELYAGYKDFLVSDRVITFNDTNGELLALKPDVTLSIVRGSEYLPGRKQKVCYRESVYRPAGSERRFREIAQCGLECIGDLDGYDVYEVLRLAGESLRRISGDAVLSVSHLGIVNSLLDALHAGESAQQRLLKLIAERNRHELAEFFALQGWDRALLEDVEKLLSLSCALRDLPASLQDLNLSWLQGKCLSELEELSALLTDDDDGMFFDFSVINDIHYYNGIVFQGFVQGIAEKVLAGGRYDSLLRRMGRKGGAIGFAVYFGLLEWMNQSEKTPDADVLLLYDENTPLRTVRDTVHRLRAEGKSVSAQRRNDGIYSEVADLRGGNRHA